MKVVNNFLFFENPTGAGTSEVLYNFEGDTLTIQTTSASGATYKCTVEGKTDIEGDFQEILGTVISNLSGSLDIVDAITNDGIYSYDISGLAQIRVKIESVSSGAALRVFGKSTGVN